MCYPLFSVLGIMFCFFLPIISYRNLYPINRSRSIELDTKRIVRSFFLFFVRKPRTYRAIIQSQGLLSNDIYWTRIGSGIVDRIPGSVTSILQSIQRVYGQNVRSTKRTRYTFMRCFLHTFCFLFRTWFFILYKKKSR